MRALAILALSASSVLGLALSADDDGDARDVRVRGTFANTAAVAPARPLPKRLWYTLRIRYRGSEGGDIERHAPGFAGEVSSLFKAEAELRPESAILLRRRPGRTFSVLAGRSLTGRVTRLDTTFSETLPHCSALERQIAGIELGQVTGSFGIAPLGQDQVELVIGGDDTTAFLAGRAELKITSPAWSCDADALQRDRLFPPSEAWRGRLLSPPLTLPRIVGREAEPVVTAGPAPRRLRTPYSAVPDNAYRIRFDGARFGARSFDRRAQLTKIIPIETATQSGFRRAQETWTLTFERCPDPRPCE